MTSSTPRREPGPVEPPGLDDLLGKVARGDEAAFATLYDRLASRVFGLALRIVRDPAQAEEVAQEAFVDMWRTAARYTGGRFGGQLGIEDVLSAPDAVLHTVAGPDGRGRVTVVVSQSRDQAVAVLGDLPVPGADWAYRLWMVDDSGQPSDKGLLAADATGGTVLIDGVRGQQVFAITNEPKKGWPSPPTDKLAVIPLT